MAVMKRVLISALAIVLTGAVALAEDMENIFDQGSVPAPKIKNSKKSSKNRSGELTYSPFETFMRKTVGSWNSERSIFVRFYEANDFEKSTLQFNKAFEGTGFQTSSNGRALLGLVQFKAGLAITGLETLFLAPTPKDISDDLKKEWVQLAPESAFAWDLVKVRWTDQWTKIFGEEIEYKLKARDVASLSDTAELKKLASQAPEGGRVQAEINWKLALAYAMNDKTDAAAKTLAAVMKSGQMPVSLDLMNLTAARMLFQNGYFDAAVKYYDKVSKKSEHWVEAQEEIAWAYIRKGEPQNAMAITKGLTGPAFANQVRAETFFVDSLSHLKVCDYPSVAGTLSDFPKYFKGRTKTLENLVNNQASPATDKAMDLLKVRRISLLDLGKEANDLPRLIVRDDKLVEYAQAAKRFKFEAQVAEKLYAKSLALTGLQGSFDQAHKVLLQKADMAEKAAISRIKELAKIEVTETKEILRKMHIVEAEMIQQVAMADTLAKNSASDKVDVKKGTTGAKGQETLKFAADDELWFDEISNYKVDVKKACHAKR
jgi:tetratricopeptide (TPR) repeat protein